MPHPLRYVILHHTAIPHPHYDLMLEPAPGQPLLTWRSPTWPPASPNLLTPLPDHRPIYLTYQGSLSNNRGQVTQIESGTYTRQSPTQILLHPSGQLLQLPA